MAERTFKVEGMSCQHCVMAVKKALDGLSGVEKTDVSIGNVNVVFDESKASDADVKAAIEKAGYKVVKGGEM